MAQAAYPSTAVPKEESRFDHTAWRRASVGGAPRMLKLLTRQTCPSCRGARLFQRPAWAQFWREWRARNGTLTELEDGSVEQWFSNQGYDPLPPEEVPCEICEGTGEVDGTIRIEDLARLLRESDDRSQPEGPEATPP